jgi:hypothetical protein
MDERNSALCEDFNGLAAHQCIIFIIAQAIATTMTRITSQNLIGIRASLRRVTLTALGRAPMVV